MPKRFSVSKKKKKVATYRVVISLMQAAPKSIPMTMEPAGWRNIRRSEGSRKTENGEKQKADDWIWTNLRNKQQT